MSVDELIASGRLDGSHVTLTGTAFATGYVAKIPFEEFAPGAATIALGGEQYRPGMAVPVIAHRCFVAAPDMERRLRSRSSGVLLRHPGLGAVLGIWGTLGDEVGEIGPIAVTGRIVSSTVEPYWGMLTDITMVQATISGERRSIDLIAVTKPDPGVIEATMRSEWSTTEENASFVRMKTIQHSLW